MANLESFRHMDNWKQDLEKFFGGGLASGLNWFQENPKADIYETDNEVFVHLEIPGLEKQEDVHIHVDSQALTIHGTVTRSSEINEDRMHRKERFTGRFQRTLALPSPVEEEGARAAYRNGVLEIRLPKVKQAAKTITVEFQ